MAPVYNYTPGELDLAFVRGEAWSMGQTVNRDLTGYTVVAAMVLDNGKEIPVAVEVTPGAEESRIDYTLTAGETAEIPLGSIRWFMGWTPPDGDYRTILAGTATVKRVT